MDFKAEIEKIINIGFEPDTELYDYLSDIKESIKRFDKRQKETAINMEEIQSLLEDEHTGQTELVNALISVIDYFDDFYCFASKDKSSPLFNQTEMMLNGIIKKISAIGLTRIHDENTEFDSSFNTIESTENDSSLPNGYITKTLRCGYVYNGEVMRKSKVVVIKN